MEIVRYDRTGKWYAEPTIPLLQRQQIPIGSAVLLAEWGIKNASGEWFPRLPGGGAFDRKLGALLDA